MTHEEFLTEVGFIIGTLETTPTRNKTIKIVKRILIKYYQTLSPTKKRALMTTIDDLKVRLNNIETINKKVNSRVVEFEVKLDALKAVMELDEKS